MVTSVRTGRGHQRLTLSGAGAASAAGKVVAPVTGMVAAADSISDMDVLRHGGMARLLDGCGAIDVGTPSRRFTFGHVRQLDASPGCWPSFCMVANAHAGAENSDPETHLVLDRHHQHVREAICAALTTRRSGAGRTQPSTLTTRPKCCPCWRTA